MYAVGLPPVIQLMNMLRPTIESLRPQDAAGQESQNPQDARGDAGPMVPASSAVRTT